MEDKLSRREFLRATVGIALAGSAVGALGKLHVQAEERSEKVDLAVVKSSSVESATISAIESLGGIGKFVKSGDVVVIKPNMGFPNPPGWGSTTSPEVVVAIAKLCVDAGARTVLIFDHPMGRPDECLKRTGIAEACKNLGSEKVRVSVEMEQRDYVEVKLEKAKALEKTDVHKAILRADAFINVPVAKSHSATTVSFSMKNLMGAIWDRGYLHQKIDLHQGIADLSTFIKPSLIVMDATRVLSTRGPEGPGMTEKLDTVIAGTDPVAVDSYSTMLSSWNGRKYAPGDIKHIALASAMQIGEMDLDKLGIKRLAI